MNLCRRNIVLSSVRHSFLSGLDFGILLLDEYIARGVVVVTRQSLLPALHLNNIREIGEDSALMHRD
jgi:hypothetical protein